MQGVAMEGRVNLHLEQVPSLCHLPSTPWSLPGWPGSPQPGTVCPSPSHPREEGLGRKGRELRSIHINSKCTICGNINIVRRKRVEFSNILGLNIHPCTRILNTRILNTGILNPGILES